MKHIAFVLFLFFLSHFSFGQENIIPNHYRPIKEVYGDLDKDGIEEKLVVYNMSDKEDDVNGVDREVVIFRKEKENWVVWHRSTNAVGNSRDGGMMGDPFEDVEISKGILIIRQSGGSSWKWGHSDKYRYQNNRFELIGYTSHYGRPCNYWEDFDFNLMTGKIILKKEYERCDDDDDEKLEVYKTETETFRYQLKQKITLENRNKVEVKIISPKYKHDLYL